MEAAKLSGCTGGQLYFLLFTSTRERTKSDPDACFFYPAHVFTTPLCNDFVFGPQDLMVYPFRVFMFVISFESDESYMPSVMPISCST